MRKRGRVRSVAFTLKRLTVLAGRDNLPRRSFAIGLVPTLCVGMLSLTLRVVA
jgi:hypothetical protein